MLFDPKWAPIEVTTEPWRDLLLKAADIIEEKGWIKGSYHHSGGACAVGAIALAANLDWVYLAEERSAGFQGPATEAVTHLLAQVNKRPGLFNRKYDNVQRWNDDTGRTKEEVVAAMRKAANAV